MVRLPSSVYVSLKAETKEADIMKNLQKAMFVLAIAAMLPSYGLAAEEVQEMDPHSIVETAPMNIMSPKEAAEKRAKEKQAVKTPAKDIRTSRNELNKQEKPDPGPGTAGGGSGLFPMSFVNGERETVNLDDPDILTIDEALALPVAALKDEITLAGGVIGHEKDNIYILGDGGDQRLRADLGKHGGRLILRTFFTVTGHMTVDAEGPLFVAESMNYKDPVANIAGDKEYDWTGRQGRGRQGLKMIRDSAFDHWPNGSNLARYMVNHPEEAVNADEYPRMSAAEINKAEKGTKVRVIGRAISTRSDGNINFWDEDMDNVILKMEGAYIPLGQHCTILGIKEDGYVRVVYMGSLAEQGPGMDIPEIEK